MQDNNTINGIITKKYMTQNNQNQNNVKEADELVRKANEEAAKAHEEAAKKHREENENEGKPSH